MKQLIDKNEILEFLDSRAGFYDSIEDLAKEYSDYNMTSLLEFAEEIVDGVSSVIQSMSVVEERETTICSYFKRDYDIAPYYTTKIYLCNNCWEDIEIDPDEKELKFCPHCGAKYERIVKDD